MEHVVALPREYPPPSPPSLRPPPSSPRGPQEDVEHVLAPAVHERCDGLPADIVEPSADERESAAGKVVHGRREIELAVEPRLDRVLVRRGYVREMAGHERAHVARNHLVGDRLGPRASQGELPTPYRHDRERSGHGQS